MEVHHHPHVEKKGFKEYFLEFLMIFLAVTLGFFAENIRETYHDKKNIHQLAISLTNDLKIDTTHLAAQLQRSNLKIKQLDSLHAILQQPKDKINKLDLQRLVVGATLVFNFVPSGGTISEMKSTGVLRLFSGTKIPRLINNYESIISSTKIIENFEITYSKKYIEEGFISKHFTPENIFKYADSASLSSHSFIPVNDKLRNITQDDLVQFNVDLALYKIDALFLNNFYKKDYQMAVDFMKDIQDEFKIRNE
ncbi:MAG TPA: hypothetical protein VET23_05330 [Chitinophagaceae bacterium]|nr:hypothetical protein [Chitinophagaceae bacterium]